MLTSRRLHSKSAVQVIGQYYQFLRLGKSGYRAIMTNLTAIADALAASIAAMGDGKLFTIISDGGGLGLPLVAWRLTEAGKYDGGSCLVFGSRLALTGQMQSSQSRATCASADGSFRPVCSSYSYESYQYTKVLRLQTRWRPRRTSSSCSGSWSARTSQSRARTPLSATSRPLFALPFTQVRMIWLTS